MDSVLESWQRIDDWLEVHAPQVWKGLQPGVSKEEMHQAESIMGVTFPEEYRASYSIHNGSNRQYILMGQAEFISLHEVVERWKMYQDLLQDGSWAQQKPERIAEITHPPLLIQPVWRHPKWISFLDMGGGDEWCLDLAPGPEGQEGQVLVWWHETGPDRVIFSNIAALLENYADGLEAGLYLGQPSQVCIWKLTHLATRRAVFLGPSRARPLLLKAIQLSWSSKLEESLSTFNQVLQMAEATPEDRFQAYYGLVTLGTIRMHHWGEAQSFFAQWEAEAGDMPDSHWVHQELALFAHLFQ